MPWERPVSGGSPRPAFRRRSRGLQNALGAEVKDHGPRKGGSRREQESAVGVRRVGTVRRENPDTHRPPVLRPRWAVVRGAPEAALRGSVLSRSPTAIGSLRMKRLLQRKARRDSMREAGRREGEPPESPRRKASQGPVARSYARSQTTTEASSLRDVLGERTPSGSAFSAERRVAMQAAGPPETRAARSCGQPP